MNNKNDYGMIDILSDISDENSKDYDGIFKSRAFRGVWEGYYYQGNKTREPYQAKTSITVKPEYNQADYSYYRPAEYSPRQSLGQMAMAMNAYRYVPIVRNVLDMMADFTVQGIRIVHRNNRQLNAINEWADKVNFYQVSERICHMLYTLGTAPVQVLEGKVPTTVERNWSKTSAADDMKFVPTRREKRKVPLGYKILNPMTLEVIGGNIAVYAGQPIYGLRLSQKFLMEMNKLERLAMTSEKYGDILKRIPQKFRDAVKGKKRVVPLDQSKLEVLFYKKNDWETWPVPMLASIFSSLIQLEKLHLADSSALDGAISQIRLWRLGIYNPSNPSGSILPKRPAINKLRNILANLGTGVLDLVWGPELDFKESSSQVHNYLGSEKYQQVMAEIHAGLGIPQTLTGASSKGSNSGFTNNAISMKTLIERLEFGRRILAKFWNNELRKVQESLGWKFAPQVIFDRRVLADEGVEKKLVLDMWDRDIVSTKTVLELADRDPELEFMRIRRQMKQIETGKLPKKAGPYHNPQTDEELKKIILHQGGVCPSEVGLELDEKDENEECFLDKQMKIAEKNNNGVPPTSKKPTSPGGDGRPKNTRDTSPRKQRQDKPKTIGKFVDLFIWGNKSQAKINEIVTPFYLDFLKKDTLRSLNKKEASEFESFKFSVLAHFAPYAKVNEENVYTILENIDVVDADLIINKEALIAIFENRNERKPNVEELRQIQSSAYALYYEEQDV